MYTRPLLRPLTVAAFLCVPALNTATAGMPSPLPTSWTATGAQPPGIATMWTYAKGLDFAVPWNKPPNDLVYKCNLRLFVNPAIGGPYFDKQGFGLSHVAGNVHVLPIRTVKPSKFDSSDRNYDPMYLLSKSDQVMTMAQITDGASNTLLIGTVSQRFKPWGHPANIRDPARGIDRSPDGFGAPPSWNGAIFAFCDGHTALINRKADPRVLRQLASPSGGEPPISGY
jgi:prepilin-type processing-associated H-X9-DG protein